MKHSWLWSKKIRVGLLLGSPFLLLAAYDIHTYIPVTKYNDHYFAQLTATTHHFAAEQTAALGIVIPKPKRDCFPNDPGVVLPLPGVNYPLPFAKQSYLDGGMQCAISYQSSYDPGHDLTRSELMAVHAKAKAVLAAQGFEVADYANPYSEDESGIIYIESGDYNDKDFRLCTSYIRYQTAYPATVYSAAQTRHLEYFISCGHTLAKDVPAGFSYSPEPREY